MYKKKSTFIFSINSNEVGELKRAYIFSLSNFTIKFDLSFKLHRNTVTSSTIHHFIFNKLY